jgi:hypothetical protein
MVRTQIYLNEAQKSALDRLSSERGATVSALIRQAVDQFIVKKSPDFEEALNRSFGIWRHRHEFDEPNKYVRKIRREWEERDKRN